MKNYGKPFIPSWLDEAGLTQPQFRIYCHLLRSAGNGSGIAWPSYERIGEVCGTSKTTTRRSLEALIKAGLLEKLNKGWQGSCRYRPIVPSEGLLNANSSTRELIEVPTIVPPEYYNSSTRVLPIVPPEGHEGNPKKGIQRRVSTYEVSSEGIQFAHWFKTTLPDSVKLKANWETSFAKAHDDLVKLDKRSPEEIRGVCQWARNDPFWQSNVMSPAKLRKKNRDGITYFDVIAAKIKSAKQTKPAFNGIIENLEIPIG